MIPPFDELGYLPPGVHLATLDEIDVRFGRESEIRRVQMQSLRWLVDLAKGASARRLIINGSFVTRVPEPNDVDCILLVGPGFREDIGVGAELAAGLPFLDCDLVDEEDFSLVQSVFATDRRRMPKGMVEVIL